jgi:cell division protein FtsW (lipid II flippase)
MRVFLLLLLIVALVQAAPTKAHPQQEESHVKWGIKVGFWLLLGVTIGVYFQARLKLKDLMKGVIDVALYALFIGVAVYTMFAVEELVREYF